MSLYSNRAIYLANGRAAYNATTGRALFADAGLISSSMVRWFYGYASIAGWSEANYSQAQDDSLAALQADTTLAAFEANYWAGNSVHAIAGCKSWYGTISYAQNNAIRYTFDLPVGKRGSITKMGLLANAGSARFYNLSYYYPSIVYDYSSWDDFGASIKLFFSESSTAYADGDDLYSGTADIEYTFADINDYHIDNGSVPGYMAGFTTRDPHVFPQLSFSLDAATLDKINEFASDTIYLWAVVKKDTNFPYYLDQAPSNYDNEFDFGAKFYNPRLLVSDH